MYWQSSISIPLLLPRISCPLIIWEHIPSYFPITFPSPLRWLFYVRLILSFSFNSSNVLRLMEPSPNILVRRSYRFYENGSFTLLLLYDTSAEVIRHGELEWRHIRGIRSAPLHVGTRFFEACDILVCFYNSPVYSRRPSLDANFYIWWIYKYIRRNTLPKAFYSEKAT